MNILYSNLCSREHKFGKSFNARNRVQCSIHSKILSDYRFLFTMVSLIVGEYIPCRKSFAKIQTASNNLLQYHPEPSYTPFYEAYIYPLWQKRIISAGLSFIPPQRVIQSHSGAKIHPYFLMKRSRKKAGMPRPSNKKVRKIFSPALTLLP